MRWRHVSRVNPIARDVADRHYNRQSVGAQDFCPPGRCTVLLCEHPDGNALWVTSWPFAEYVQHAWAGAWVNSCFRNEGPHLSSELILEAVAATCHVWTPPSDLGLITFVDASKVNSRNPGYCYQKAGFTKVGFTKGGLLAYQLLPEEMPPPLPATGMTYNLFGDDA